MTYPSDSTLSKRLIKRSWQDHLSFDKPSILIFNPLFNLATVKNENTMCESVIDLNALKEISRGNSDRMLHYLYQFEELIPKRSAELRKALNTADRTYIRKLIHSMSPQVQFFGIKEVVKIKERLELGYEHIPQEEMNSNVIELLSYLGKAVIEVSQIIKELELKHRLS